MHFQTISYNDNQTHMVTYSANDTLQVTVLDFVNRPYSVFNSIYKLCSQRFIWLGTFASCEDSAYKNKP